MTRRVARATCEVRATDGARAAGVCSKSECVRCTSRVWCTSGGRMCNASRGSDCACSVQAEVHVWVGHMHGLECGARGSARHHSDKWVPLFLSS